MGIRLGVICAAMAAAYAQSPGQSKISAEARQRLEADATAPVFIVLSAQPQKAVAARVEMEFARGAGAPLGRDAFAAAWRARAAAEMEREVAPQQDRVEAMLRARGATRLGRYFAVNMLTAEIPRWALADLESDPEVSRVFLAKTRQGQLQTSVPALGAPAFWTAGFAGSGQSVALIDTGVRANHPAFAGTSIVSRLFLNFGRASECFDDDATTADDKQGHGTHIAGIIMSHGSTGFADYFGVARGLSTLYNLKAGFKSKPPCGSGSAEGDDRDLVQAMQWAAMNTPSRILSLSFGTPVTGGDDDDDFASTVDQISDLNDAFIAVSAGNSGPGAGTVTSPGIAYNIVSVANWSSRGSVSNSSSRGPTSGGRFKPDIAAPGTSIVSTAFNWDASGQSAFVPKSGTSMSAPHIAGSAALLRQAGVTQPLAMKAILINSADESNWAADRGWGYANLATARPQTAFHDTQTVDPGAAKFYRLNSPGSLAATLTWNRHIFTTAFRFNNLDLFAYALAGGAALAQSDAPLQNVEKVALQSASDAVLKVRSAQSDTAFEFFAIAFSKAFSRAAGPALSVGCSHPATGVAGAAVTGSCAVSNTGDLPAFAPVLTITGPDGPRVINLATLQPGSSAATGTSFTSASTGIKNFTAAASSGTYGETFSAATSYSITISAAPSAPGPPANPNPSNNATGIATAGTLSWSAASGAATYDVYLGINSPLTLLAANLTSTSAAFSGLTPGVAYSWQVIARNASGSTISELWRFTTGLSTGLVFVPIAPCRLVDTRNANGALGGPRLNGDTTRTFPLSGHPCVAPAAPAAYSLNITVVPQGPLSYLSVWPAGDPLPLVSTLNALNGAVKANAAIVPASAAGAVNVYVTNNAHAVIDINGYFLPPGAANGLVFYPLAPCRAADTRAAGGQMAAGSSRNFDLRASACQVPANAQSYALNATVVPSSASFGYLTLWPAGGAQPVVSTLNAVTGAVTANAAIVQAGSGGAVSAFVSDNANLILDIVGYFAPPGGVGALTFRAVTPCRSLDTRASGSPLAPNAPRDFAIANACGVPAGARAYSLNATVVPPAAFGFLTVWPAGSARPSVSTLNALDGQVTSNAAIVSAGSPGGQVSALGSDAAHLILDVNGYFAP